jgi:hypothetical protein
VARLAAVLAGLAALLACGPVRAAVEELEPGRWTGGAGIGFMADTPDGAAEFGFHGHADYIVMPRLSIGPLAQYAGVGNDVLFGASAQARYWWPLQGSERLKLVLQGGLGFIRAGIKDADSGTADTYGSFLIPVGIGLDYAISERLALTADVLLNFTSLGDRAQVGGREVDLHTNVLPAFYLGVRF